VIIGLGEAGVLYAQGLVDLGWTVTGYDPGDVATPPGVIRADSPEDLPSGVDAVLCLVGGRAAVSAAESVAGLIGHDTIFIDMNSASAATKQQVASSVGEDAYADVAVVGSVPEGRSATAVVISGRASTRAADLFIALGAPVEDIHGEPGDAAQRKLLRSSFMKGLGALIVETLDAAAAMGARNWALEQISQQHSGGGTAVERLYSGTIKHADRRGHEADEAAEMIERLGARSTMTRAAALSHREQADAQVLPRDQLRQAYASIPVANIGDARDRMGMVDGGLRAIWPGAKAVGWARTVWVTAGDNKYLHTAIADIRPGDFLIVNGHGHNERALLGELMAEKAKKLGAVGIVVDGALRDRQDLEEMQFPAWARAVTPAGPFKNGPGKINVPVAIGGVVVTPGDLVIADDDGVIVVPASEAADTLSRARAINIDEANRRKAILEMVSQ